MVERESLNAFKEDFFQMFMLAIFRFQRRTVSFFSKTSPNKEFLYVGIQL